MPEISDSQPAIAAWTDLAAVVLLSSAVFLYAHWPALTHPYVINDDVRQQIFWMQQWLDPALFPGDLLADYARHYVPWGVKGLYWLASWAVGPLYFSKVLPGLLFILLGMCLYGMGATLAGRRLGWMMVGLSWLMPFFLDHLAGGLARAFAAPLLALFWLSWLARRPWGMGLALLLQALFIPYIFPVAATAAVLASLAARAGWGHDPPLPARPTHLLVLAAGAALVVLMQIQFNAGGFGPLVRAGEMANRPEFYAQGRYPILPVPSFLWELVSPWEFNAPFRQGGPLAGALVCAVVGGLALLGLPRVDWRSLRPAWQSVAFLGLASLVLYFLARIFLLRMFVPDRYLIYTLNLFYCLLLALCLAASLRIGRWPRTLAVAGLLALAVLGAWRLKGVGLKDYSAYQPLYAALAQTPKDALVAGHPNLMDNVPTLARRRALATYKLAHVWSAGYWDRLRPRLEDLLAAYYAADPREVIAFARKHRVSFMVVDDRHFTPDFLAGGWRLVPYDRPHRPGTPKGLAERNYCPFFAPFDEQIRCAVGDRRQFALLSWPTSHTLMLDEHLRLLDLRPWLTQEPANDPPAEAP